MPKEAYEPLKKQIDAWPDFFEKQFQKKIISDTLLGRLYRDVSNEEAMENFCRFDYEKSIQLNYELDERILA